MDMDWNVKKLGQLFQVLIVQFRVRYDRWIKEVKMHFLQG